MGAHKRLPYFFASQVFCARLVSCHSHYSKKTTSLRLLKKLQPKRREPAKSMMWKSSTRPFGGRANAWTVDGRKFLRCWNSTIWKRVSENRHGLVEAAPSSHILIEPSKRWKRKWQGAAYYARPATSAVTTTRSWISWILPIKIWDNK